ncbi:MAG: hypothetical protein IPJ39_22545 [Saprospiraceae bacterium]|nr:hypothetical protein [Saprospiraceae bacterium]
MEREEYNIKAFVAAFENVGINRNDEILCKSDTNSFTRYLREKNSKSGANLSIQSSEDFEINYTGCPEGANHLHIISKDTEEISDYRSILDESKKVDQSSCFEFCLFAYSGNRFINISNDSPEKTNHIKNPIYGSLAWMNDTPIFDRNIILFLDEIEAHLHIEWQRKNFTCNPKIISKRSNFHIHSLAFRCKFCR